LILVLPGCYEVGRHRKVRRSTDRQTDRQTDRRLLLITAGCNLQVPTQRPTAAGGACHADDYVHRYVPRST
jgi:hypothetical protein